MPKRAVPYWLALLGLQCSRPESDGLFDELDKDRSGSIEFEELQRSLKTHATVELDAAGSGLSDYSYTRGPGRSYRYYKGTPLFRFGHGLSYTQFGYSDLAIGAVPRGRCQSVMAAARDEEIIIVFGGACHHDPKPGQVYGDMVMDLDDIVLLHLPTLTWLPADGMPTKHEQRGQK